MWLTCVYTCFCSCVHVWRQEVILILLFITVCAHACVGQKTAWGSRFLPPCSSRDLTQAVGLGSKHLSLLSPLASLSALLINLNLTILARLADQCEPLIHLCLPLALPSPNTGVIGTCRCMGFYMAVGIQTQTPMLTQQTLYPLSATQYPCIEKKKKSFLEEVLHNQFKHQASCWSVW